MGNRTDSFYSEQLFYVDRVSNPSEYPFYYQVYNVDNCDNISSTGQYARTIFAAGRHNGDESNIWWGQYETWNSPIVEHHVNYKSLSGDVYLGKVDGGTFTFSDLSFYIDINGYYPYQIHSINADGDTSYSNIAYVSGSGIYDIPNAFSPNGDGLNDIFNFYTLFATGEETEEYSDFEIEVYNRWGGIIYYGTDIDKPWDGTSKGELQEPGVYLYRIKFTDGNENKTFVSGPLHLLR